MVVLGGGAVSYERGTHAGSHSRSLVLTDCLVRRRSVRKKLVSSGEIDPSHQDLATELDTQVCLTSNIEAFLE